MIAIISAIGSDNIIGNGNGLPWSIPEEYEQFLDFIKDNTVIMGRRSYEIFKKDMLPKRMIVVSKTLSNNGNLVYDSLSEALEYAKSFSEDVFICGGESIYKESIDIADYMFLSYIKGQHRGNVFFPDFDKSDWVVETQKEHDEFEFFIYKRK